MNPVLKNLGKALLILAIFLVANFISSFLTGVFTLAGGNISIIGLNQIAFDPALTIAYIILFYFIVHFYNLTQRAMYWIFLFTLFLSFTVNFIQGAILLVILPPLLKRFKLITTEAAKQ